MTTENDIAQLFAQWNQALLTENPDEVVSLYASDAVLLPTVSNQVRHNHAEIRDYFVQFLDKKPEGCVDESNIRVLGDIAIHSGVYTFKLKAVNTSVQARFTYVYRKEGNEWKIIEHHSSAMPETVAA